MKIPLVVALVVVAAGVACGEDLAVRPAPEQPAAGVRLADDQIQKTYDLLADYLPWTEAVRLPKRLPRTPECRDPHDLPFLHLAYAAKADALITGDADLLTLAKASRVAILTPAQAVERLG